MCGLPAFAVMSNHQLIVDRCCCMSWVVMTMYCEPFRRILLRWCSKCHVVTFLGASFRNRCVFLRVAFIYLITRLRKLHVATLFVVNSVRNGWGGGHPGALGSQIFSVPIFQKIIFYVGLGGLRRARVSLVVHPFRTPWPPWWAQRVRRIVRAINYYGVVFI